MTTLQFQVNKIWAIKYGLIFERSLEKKEFSDAVPEEKNKRSDLSSPSTHSFRVPFRSSTIDLRRQSIEQSFIQNQKNFNDEKSMFCSTQYLNLPSQIHGDFSPVASSVIQSEESEGEATELPTIFSLSHPLDEICPVVSKHGKKIISKRKKKFIIFACRFNDLFCFSENLSYISNPDVKIVFTSESPSLCMTYDSKSKIHSVYTIRKALAEESEVCLHRESMLSRTTRSHNSFSTAGKPSLSNSNASFNVQNGNVSLPAFLNAR